MRARWQQNECITFLNITELKKLGAGMKKSCSNGLWLISAGGHLLIICFFCFFTVSGCAADASVLVFALIATKDIHNLKESDAIIINTILQRGDNSQINVNTIFLWNGFSYKMRSPLRNITVLALQCYVAAWCILVWHGRTHRHLLRAQQKTGLAGQRVAK